MTKHCMKRLKERVSLRGNAARSFVKNALEKGLYASCFPAAERAYLLDLESDYDDIYCLYYADYIFIFNKYDKCITLYHAPNWFMKKSKFNGKERIRKIKKYYKYNQN